MNNALDQLLDQPGIWRAGEQQRETGLDHIATGFAELDDCLPGRGWPQGALTELIHAQSGIGELRLIMPALARLSRQGRWLALIAPPYIPYAPALAAMGVDLDHVLLIHPRSEDEALWAVEQALRSGTCGAVLAWIRRSDERALRRLQLAAETGGTWGVLYRGETARGESSPAAIRMSLSARDQGLEVEFLKCRGGNRRQSLELDISAPVEPTPQAPSQGDTPRGETVRPLKRPMATRHTPAATTAPRRVDSKHRRAAQIDLPLTDTRRSLPRQATPLRNRPKAQATPIPRQKP